MRSLTWFVCMLLLGFWSGPAMAFGPQTEAMLEAGPFPVGTRKLILIDKNRPVPATPYADGSPVRRFKGRVWYPAEHRPLEWLRVNPAPLEQEDAPHPVVIYSHGFMSFYTEGTYLAQHLASHGYIVLAVNYPLTHYFAPGKPYLPDVANQPIDISFILNELSSWNQDDTHWVKGGLDLKRVAAVGLSLGGLTSTLSAFHADLRDPRLSAAISIAGPIAMFTKRFYTESDIPFLMIAGDTDAIVDYTKNAGTLRARNPAATVVTLHGASHIGFANIAATMFRWYKNADKTACRHLMKNLPEEEDFVDDLGGEAVGIVLDDLGMPCQVDTWKRAMRPVRQQALTSAAVFAFLEARFADDVDTRHRFEHYIRKTMGAENPDVTVSAPE